MASSTGSAIAVIAVVATPTVSTTVPTACVSPFCVSTPLASRSFDAFFTGSFLMVHGCFSGDPGFVHGVGVGVLFMHKRVAPLQHQNVVGKLAFGHLFDGQFFLDPVCFQGLLYNSQVGDFTRFTACVEIDFVQWYQQIGEDTV